MKWQMRMIHTVQLFVPPLHSHSLICFFTHKPRISDVCIWVPPSKVWIVCCILGRAPCVGVPPLYDGCFLNWYLGYSATDSIHSPTSSQCSSVCHHVFLLLLDLSSLTHSGSELKACRIHTVSESCRLRSILEDMTKMCSTLLTWYLGTDQTGVRDNAE